MALRPSVLAKSQPYKQRAEGCAFFKIVDAKLIDRGLVYVYTTHCPGSKFSWRQIVLIESSLAISYYFIDFLEKAKKQVAKYIHPLVFVNNFLALWQRVKDKPELKILTTAINTILEGQISVRFRAYKIKLPTLILVTDSELVDMEVRAFYNRTRRLKDMLDFGLGEVVIKVFCECPFFQYWGPYYLSNTGTFGMLANEAMQVSKAVGVYLKVEPFKYSEPPRPREDKLITTKTGKIYRNPTKLFKDKFRQGISWERFDTCKHVYKVLEIERYGLLESFSAVARRLVRQFQDLVQVVANVYTGLKKEDINFEKFQKILNYNIDCLLGLTNEEQDDGILLRYLVKC